MNDSPPSSPSSCASQRGQSASPTPLDNRTEVLDTQRTGAASLPRIYYQEPGIDIWLGDCRDVLPLLPKVDLVLTDPPYGIGYSRYESHVDSEHGYIEWMWPVIEASESLVFDGGAVAVFQAAKSAPEWGTRFPRKWRPIALPKLFGQILPSPVQARTDYVLWWPVGVMASKYETGFATFRDFFISRDVCVTSSRPNHPCPRPLDTMRYLVRMLSGTDGLILDPFMGSGTTLVAAKQLGRRAIGVEIEEKYCRIAAERLRTTTPPLPFDEIQQRQEPLKLPMFDGVAPMTDGQKIP